MKTRSGCPSPLTSATVAPFMKLRREGGLGRDNVAELTFSIAKQREESFVRRILENDVQMPIAIDIGKGETKHGSPLG